MARIDGYDKIPSLTSTPPAGRGLTHGQRVRRIVANALVARGFVEVLTYPFVSTGLADTFGLAADDERRQAVRVVNPLSDEAPLMRTSVLATLVDALRRNVSRGRDDVGLFEIGMVTLPAAGAAHTAPVPGVDRRPDAETVEAIMRAIPPQPRHVAAVLTGRSSAAGWWGPGRRASWEDVVESVHAVAKALAVEVVVVADRDRAPWHPGRCARVELTDGTLVGHAGELHPKVLAALGLPARTCALELDVEVLTAASAPDDALPGVLRPSRPPSPTSPSSSPTPSPRPSRRGRCAPGPATYLEDAAALRRLRRRPGGGGQHLAGLPAHLPRPGPHPDDRRGQRLPRRRGRGPRPTPWAPPSADARPTARRPRCIQPLSCV